MSDLLDPTLNALDDEITAAISAFDLRRSLPAAIFDAVCGVMTDLRMVVVALDDREVSAAEANMSSILELVDRLLAGHDDISAATVVGVLRLATVDLELGLDVDDVNRESHRVVAELLNVFRNHELDSDELCPSVGEVLHLAATAIRHARLRDVDNCITASTGR